jgi:dynein heavy chain
MCEDLNSILNSGDVTNIYNEKDMEEIVDHCKAECIKKNLQPNKMNIFTQYLLRVKRNIHLIIAMSPLGDAFTTRLRMFPSFICCSTIDWFTEWPEEALVGVGKVNINFKHYKQILFIKKRELFKKLNRK